MTEYKTFTMRLPKETWVFLKNLSTQREQPISEIFMNYVDKMRAKKDKKDKNNVDE